MKVSFIFGTRPEAIKMAPLILGMKNMAEFEVNVCVTGQHREMLDQVLDVFEIIPDVDIALMEDNQTLASLTSRAIKSIASYLDCYKPDLVLVQGDTTTAFCASLSAFYNMIPVGHVEAGLRTYNKFSPFPEEINRVMITHIADYHFAPTQSSKNSLVRENVDESRIFVTGNTVIDALNIAVEKVRQKSSLIPGLPDELFSNDGDRKLVLITGHRRESFGDGFKNICEAVSRLANSSPEVVYVYPVHLNPNVREIVFNMLKGYKNIYLIEPLSYLPFVSLLDRCSLILTDSGGIQEEAPSLGKPVLVMRDTTERPEGVEVGTAKLVGTDPNKIVREVSELLTNELAYKDMANKHNPYGDGKATDRIIKAIKDCEDIVDSKRQLKCVEV